MESLKARLSALICQVQDTYDALFDIEQEMENLYNDMAKLTGDTSGNTSNSGETITIGETITEKVDLSTPSQEEKSESQAGFGLNPNK